MSDGFDDGGGFTEDGAPQGDAAGGDTAADPTEALLGQLAEAGGALGGMAAELLVIRQDRAEAAERDAAVLKLAEATEPASLMALSRAMDEAEDGDEFARLSAEFETTKASLRFQQEQAAVAADTLWLQQMTAMLLADKTLPREEIVKQLREYADSLLETQAQLKGFDALEDSPQWADYLETKRATEAAIAVAEEMRSPTDAEVVAQAQAEMDEILDRVLTPGYVAGEASYE